MVTGGAGFIGSHLVDRLVTQGYDVIVLDDLSSGSLDNLAQAPFITFIDRKVEDLPSVASKLGTIDLVYHLAALISGHDSLLEPEIYLKANVNGVLKIIEFARQANVGRIVFSSSSTVYGSTRVATRSETDVPSPITVYALSKLAGERLLAMYSAMTHYTHISLRLFNVYGPRQNPAHPYANVTCKFAEAAASNSAIDLYGDGEQTRDFIYVDDVVDAFLAVATDAPEPVYNVGTGVETSINTLLSRIERISGRRMERRIHEDWPNDVRAVRANVDLIRRDIGFSPAVDLDRGLEKTIEFFKLAARRG
jgi:UDP-glucose 4-epimerase